MKHPTESSVLQMSSMVWVEAQGRSSIMFLVICENAGDFSLVCLQWCKTCASFCSLVLSTVLYGSVLCGRSLSRQSGAMTEDQIYPETMCR